MSFYQILIDILIPLLCALIGGALTFGGVFYTIKKQETKEKQEEILKYKPYLKISSNQSKYEVCCREYIEDFINQEKHNKDYYTFMLNTFYIINSNNAECVLKEIIIDNKRYPLNETILLNNEVVGITTTKNFCIGIEKPLKEIYLTATDLLGNLYYYKCEFKKNQDGMFFIQKNEEEKDLKVFRLKYDIVNIGLPEESYKSV